MALKLQTYADAGDDPAMSRAASELNDAKAALLASLENRNRLFDPELMALAIGFGKPTKSGHFSESISNALESYLPVSQAEQKRANEMAALRFELAQNALGQAQKSADTRVFMGGMQPPSVGPADIGMPQQKSTAVANLPPLDEGVQPVAPPAPIVDEQQPMSGLQQAAAPATAAPSDIDQQIARWTSVARQLAVRNPEMAKRAMEQAEALRQERAFGLDQQKFGLEQQKLEKDYKNVQPGGIVDVRTGKVTPYAVPGGAMVERPLPGGGTIMVPPMLAQQMDMAMRDGNFEAYNQLARKSQGIAQAPTDNQGVLSVQARAAAQVDAETRAKERAAAETKNDQSVLEQGSTARELANSSSRIINTVKANPNVFGVLQKPGVAPALAAFLRDEMHSGWTSFTKQNMEDFLRKSGLAGKISQEDLTALESVTGDLAQTELEYRRLFLKGQGQVSNMEGQIVPRMTGSVSMTPQGLIQRQQLIGLRAQFDASVSNAYAPAYERGMTYNKFKQTDEYKNLVKQYDTALASTFPGIAKQQAAPAGKPSTTATAVQKPASVSAGAPDNVAKIRDRLKQLNQGQ